MRSIRGLGVAMLAATALIALPASAAASNGFKADSYPVSLDGAATTTLYFAIQNRVTAGCGPDFESSLGAPSQSVTTSSSTTANCEPYFLWDLKDCQLTFNAHLETVDIGPAECGPTTLVMNLCGTLEVGPQTGLDAEYTNTTSGGKDAVKIKLTASGIEHTRKLSVCGSGGTHNDLQLEGGNWIVTATDSEEDATGVSLIPGEPSIGIFMAGGPGEGEPRLEAQQYPVDVVGEEMSFPGVPPLLTLLKVGDRAFECDTADFGLGELSEPVYNEIEFAPTYGDCHTKAIDYTVNMNSCSYVFSGIEPGSDPGSYDATQKVACGTEGDAILLDGPGCDIKIPAQTLSEPVEVLSNQAESEFDARLGSRVSGSEVKYTTNESLACLFLGVKASGEDGLLDQWLFVSGVYPQ